MQICRMNARTDIEDYKHAQIRDLDIYGRHDNACNYGCCIATPGCLFSRLSAASSKSAKPCNTSAAAALLLDTGVVMLLPDTRDDGS